MNSEGGDRRSIEGILAQARAALDRVEPAQLADEHAGGALIVDIRPVEQRSRDGALPGAVVIDRNVLEWRLDPASDHRVPEIAKRDRLIVVLCNEGYASSLAAATLRELGLQAADVIGGFGAWVAAELPTRPGFASTSS